MDRTDLTAKIKSFNFVFPAYVICYGRAIFNSDFVYDTEDTVNKIFSICEGLLSETYVILISIDQKTGLLAESIILT